MFQHTTPVDVSMLKADIANFSVNAGFTKVCDDVVTLNYVIFSHGTETGSGLTILNPQNNGSDFGGGPSNSAVSTMRLVLKDPAASCYLHFLFYTFGGNRPRDGVAEPTWYMDYYMSEGWDGSGVIDNHPGIVKMCVWYCLPASFTGLDLFSGTTSEGKLWVHVAVEEKPQIFNHLGFGSIEKFLDFTGGDFIHASLTPSIYFGQNAGGTTFAYGTDQQYNQSYLRWQPAFYCPDLDSPNKLNIDAKYRMLKGPNTSRTDMNYGNTSLRYTTGVNELPSVTINLGGGLTPTLFPLPNPWSGTSPLFPIMVYAVDGTNINYAGEAGYFKGVRALNVKNFNPKDEITLGPDTWVVYPARGKEGVIPAAYSCTYNRGYAILKIT